jgi:hypothetical protein
LIRDSGPNPEFFDMSSPEAFCLPASIRRHNHKVLHPIKN